MGYTHYWYATQDIELSRWVLFCRDIHMLLKVAEAEGYKIGDGLGRGGSPRIDEDAVWFNGVDDDSYETFGIDRELFSDREDYQLTAPESFSCCKTARRPYDAVVTAALILLYHNCGKDEEGNIILRIRSDGDRIDWQKGLELAHKANQLDYIFIPPTIQDERY